jgi:hypothetical protein
MRQVFLKCFSCSFSIAFIKKDDRLIGLNAFVSAWELYPGFDIKTTLTHFQTIDTSPIARLAIYSLPNTSMGSSLLCCMRAGNIPSGPGDL